MRSIRNAAHGAYVLSDGEAEDVGALALAADEYLRAIQQARGEVVQLVERCWAVGRATGGVALICLDGAGPTPLGVRGRMRVWL